MRVDYNAAILFDRERIVDTYRKLHLVPFTESFPFQKTFPPSMTGSSTRTLISGRRAPCTRCSTLEGCASPLPYASRTPSAISAGIRQPGADVLVNITNDAWSFSVPGAMQHMTMAVFRAVENRRSVVRSTNAGMTDIIDPNGRVLSALPPFTEGYLSGTVPVHTGPKTLYTRWGDWFPFLLLVVSAAGLAAGLAVRLRRGNPAA